MIALLTTIKEWLSRVGKTREFCNAVGQQPIGTTAKAGSIKPSISNMLGSLNINGNYHVEFKDIGSLTVNADDVENVTVDVSKCIDVDKVYAVVEIEVTTKESGGAEHGKNR